MVLKQFFRCICIVYYIYCPYISISIYLYISISLYRYISISLYLYLYISISIYIYLYLCNIYNIYNLSIYLSTFLFHPILSYFPQRPVETWPPQVLHRRDGRSPALRGRLLGAAAAAAGAVEARRSASRARRHRSFPKDSPKKTGRIRWFMVDIAN